ncbi:MAG: DUF2029 domain-containing protein [Bacteroidia bacterium]|jgi:hypothetical protein|nr:DUF2029 domain-containing protein [Bacteroidia bacterium]
MSIDKKENNTAVLIPVLVFLLGIAAVVYCYHKPLSDFGNYYYGAAFMQKNDYRLVYDVHRFNEAVSMAGGRDLFLDHTSVPPQTPLFYKPFSYLPDPFLARGVFNVLGVCCFAFMLYRLLRQYAALSFPRSLVLLAAMAYPLYQNIAFGQTYLFVASLLIAAWLAHLRSRNIMAGVWLALAVVLKITPVVLLLFFVVRRQWKLVLSCAAAYLLLSGAAMLVYGTEVFEMYYLHLLPRIADGYINDPYSASYHGFVVLLRHLGQFDAVLNPHPPMQLSGNAIVLLNLALLLPLLAVALFRSGISRPGETGAFVLLLLFLFLGSGYFSTYSLLVLPPFFILHRKGAAPVTQLVLLLVICAVPPRVLEYAPVALQHFKLYALLLLFALAASRPERGVRMNAVAAVLVLLFAALQLAKLFLPGGGPRYAYYSSKIQQHYVTDYSISNHTLTATVYSKAGKEKIALPLATATPCTLPLAPRTEYIGNGNVLYKNIVCRNDTVLFMCDAGRGVGLYHLYAVPRSKFPFATLK